MNRSCCPQTGACPGIWPRPRLLLPVAVLLGLVILAGCEGVRFREDPPLPGKRISIIPGHTELAPDPALIQTPVELPAPYINRSWPQTGGYPNHSLYHLALSGPVVEQWRTRIGKGFDKEDPVAIAPVVAGDQVFALDGHRDLVAMSTQNGEEQWRVSLGRQDEISGFQRLLGGAGAPGDDKALLGGLAYDSEVLVVTTGRTEIVAHAARDGSELWRHELQGPVRAAPTVIGGRVVVLGADNRIRVLRLDNGEEIWRHSGTPPTAGWLGDASPAATRDMTVIANSAGEINAFRIDNGQGLWNLQTQDSARPGQAGLPSDVIAPPVIDRDQVFIIGRGSGLVSLGADSGRIAWGAPVDGSQMPWIGGDWLFVVSAGTDVLALSRDRGKVRWLTRLPRFGNPEDREDPIRYAGPILAGHRLILAASSGQLIALSPYDGQILGQVELGGSLSIPPILANETLYVLTDQGTLIAFR